MLIRVCVGDWEHLCCGPAYELDEEVTWDLHLPGRRGLPGRAQYYESHHGPLVNGVTVTGRIVAVEAAGPSGELISITRLPSGRALRGFDDKDSRALISLESGESVDGEIDIFTVVLDIDDDAIVPTRVAR